MKEEGRLVFVAVRERGKTGKPVRKREMCLRVKVHEIKDTCALPEQSVKYLCDP